ncbi:solute carrier family 22 member 5-like isoform X3 [Astatotilapia calliptera]|uniref:Major facilitator superfamily (MFS) profile domain-containing protein n=1 Tax=Astatotilapia calliptera TaxID=8154 RepID=A0A3P8NG87_ASTCA|nr:solute carrier family 22 member 5-like isoform X3 [Astatotilapia calliptera]
MSNGNIRDFDEITSFLGDYGLFQILVMVLLSVSTMPAGYMGVIVVFVSDTPEHYCRSPNSSSRNGTEWEQENGFHDRGSWMGPGSCSRYKLNENWTEKAAGFNDTEQCLDGWVFSTDKYTTTIVSEWDLVCDNAWKVPFSTSFFFVGALIGSFISGHLSDRLIPESPRWLLQKGRVEEAELVIRKAAQWNRVPAPEVIFRAGDCLELMQNKDEEEQTYTYMDLMRTHNIRNITILGVFIWISVAMVYYGLSLNSSNLHGNIYLNCFISAAIDIVVYVATWLLIDRAPRPTLLFTTLMFCGIMLLVIKLVPEDMPIMVQVLALVGKTGVSAAYCFIYVFFTELMPTVVRNMGLGICATAARIGAIICPYLLYMGLYSKILPYIIFGTASIMAAAVSMLLPDTRNSKLPDLLIQTKHIRRFSCCSKEALSTRPDATEGFKEVN